MDSSVVVQLIETGGILLISIVGFITYIMLSKRKNSANDEVSLLKDCLYYKLLVDKYKEHVSDFEDKNYLNTYRAELRDDLGYSPSRLATEVILLRV